MRQERHRQSDNAEKTVRDIRRATRRRFSAEDKIRIVLENYYLPGDLKIRIGAFVEHYNHQRYHESISNLTPADVYFGRAHIILMQREKIKRQTIEQRRLQHRKNAA